MLLKTVGIIGSSTRLCEDAKKLGCWLAKHNIHLLTGGGQGVMLSASQGYCCVPAGERLGRCIGIIPSDSSRNSPKAGYPNEFVEIPIYTHLPGGIDGKDLQSRNHINVLTSDVIVAFSGGSGTSAEVQLAITYERPIIAFIDTVNSIPNLPDEVEVRNSLEPVCEFIMLHLT